jgi:hypothetical protein
VPPALRKALPSPALLGSPDGCLHRTSPAAVSSSLALQEQAGSRLDPRNKIRQKGRGKPGQNHQRKELHTYSGKGGGI